MLAFLAKNLLHFSEDSQRSLHACGSPITRAISAFVGPFCVEQMSSRPSTESKSVKPRQKEEGDSSAAVLQGMWDEGRCWRGDDAVVALRFLFVTRRDRD